jgi:hypothetical protein
LVTSAAKLARTSAVLLNDLSDHLHGRIEARSNDLFILAKVTLRAAIRDRDDLLALLNESAPRAPAKPAPIGAVARGDGLLV